MAPTPHSISDPLAGSAAAPNTTPNTAPNPAPNVGATSPTARAPRNYVYKFAALSGFDANVEVNATNADFYGPSPGLVRVETQSGHFVPMRQFVVGDSITFDLSELAGQTVTVKWFCRLRDAAPNNDRILMDLSNETTLTDGKTLTINPRATTNQECWGMWAEITLDTASGPQKFITIDPDGVMAPVTPTQGRTPAIYTYKFAALPEFDPAVDVNAANADFVGRSPGLAHVATPSPHFVPMRQFVAGDVIRFDLKDLEKPDETFTVMWICRQRHANPDKGRILMGSSNDTQLTDGMELQINPHQPSHQEHWGMWAEIEVTATHTDGKVTRKYTTADPEGVIGNGTGPGH